MHQKFIYYYQEEEINPNPKPVVKKRNLDFQVGKQYLHKIKKLTCFSSILMLRYLNKVYFYFTLESLGLDLNDH
jgi:hypothetical protein